MLGSTLFYLMSVGFAASADAVPAKVFHVVRSSGFTCYATGGQEFGNNPEGAPCQRQTQVPLYWWCWKITEDNCWFPFSYNLIRLHGESMEGTCHQTLTKCKFILMVNVQWSDVCDTWTCTNPKCCTGEMMLGEHQVSRTQVESFSAELEMECDTAGGGVQLQFNCSTGTFYPHFLIGYGALDCECDPSPDGE